jgi:hypothetical protein
MRVKGSRLAAAMALLMAFGYSAVCRANTITVTSLNDPSDEGFCTLHDAITAANSANNIGVNGCSGGNGNDTINFDVGSTITLAGTLPNIVHTLTIDGSGVSIAISGANHHLIFEVNSGANLTLNDLTLTDGKSGNGGAIYNDTGTLTVTNCTVSSNVSTADGAGLRNDGTATIVNSTFANNIADNDGGGIANVGTAALTVKSSTFFQNKGASVAAGNLFNSAFGAATLEGDIFVTATNDDNCQGNTAGITDGGYNISDDASCPFSGTSQNSTDAQLSSMGLADNGGPTETIALLSISPAIDQVPPASCTDANGDPLTTDQRGFTRPAAGQNDCDIGAFEGSIGNYAPVDYQPALR